MNDVIAVVLGRLKREQDIAAHEGMQCPAKEPFDHGVQVGKYQGMKDALDILLAALEETDEDNVS